MSNSQKNSFVKHPKFRKKIPSNGPRIYVGDVYVCVIDVHASRHAINSWRHEPKSSKTDIYNP